MEGRNQLGQLVGRVRHGREHIVISEYGKPAAALVPIGELEELERLRDQADVAEARAREAAPAGVPMAHDDFMAQLEAGTGRPSSEPHRHLGACAAAVR